MNNNDRKTWYPGSQTPHGNKPSVPSVDLDTLESAYDRYNSDIVVGPWPHRLISLLTVLFSNTGVSRDGISDEVNRLFAQREGMTDQFANNYAAVIPGWKLQRVESMIHDIGRLPYMINLWIQQSNSDPRILELVALSIWRCTVGPQRCPTIESPDGNRKRKREGSLATNNRLDHKETRQESLLAEASVEVRSTRVARRPRPDTPSFPVALSPPSFPIALSPPRIIKSVARRPRPDTPAFPKALSTPSFPIALSPPRIIKAVALRPRPDTPVFPIALSPLPIIKAVARSHAQNTAGSVAPKDSVSRENSNTTVAQTLTATSHARFGAQASSRQQETTIRDASIVFWNTSWGAWMLFWNASIVFWNTSRGAWALFWNAWIMFWKTIWDLLWKTLKREGKKKIHSALGTGQRGTQDSLGGNVKMNGHTIIVAALHGGCRTQV